MLLHDYFDKMTPENLAAYHAANKKISNAPQCHSCRTDQ